MNGLENRVRAAYLAAAELIREDAVPAAARRPRAFSANRSASAGDAGTGPASHAWRIAPLATAAAVTAIAVTAGVGLPHLLSEHHARQAHSPAPARVQAQSPGTAPTSPPVVPGLPEFTVVGTDGTDLQVMQTATGHITAHVSAPAGQIINQIAGDGSDRVFYVAAQQADSTATCRTYLYRFGLNAAGQASALTPLPGISQAGGLPTALGASADGRKLAFSIVNCGTGAAHVIPPSQGIGYIGLLDTASGKVTGRWTYALDEDYPSGFSLTPDGGLLVFAQYLPDGSAIVAKKLSTDSSSGTVDQATTVIGLPGVSSLSVGAALYGCVAKDVSASDVANQLGVYDLATGHQTAVLHTWTGPETSCSVASNAVDGYVLVGIRTGQPHSAAPFVPSAIVQVLVVDVSTGQLTTVLTKSAEDTGYGISSLVAW